MNIIVVIATKNRPELLKQRSLRSVYAQINSPDQIIVVDDSDNKKSKDENVAIIEGFKNENKKIDTEHILNQRTKGAAGSWNSAIDYILLQKQVPEKTFIAILDDDDEWLPDYLKLSSECIQKYLLDMIACDFYRIEDKQKYHCTAPTKLSVNDFLIGNPGIQGANIFVRLSCFMEAGCFDENIQSSTDRDLCIRITDLGYVKYKRLATPLMKHYADSDRIRMSSPNTDTKKAGLHNFWLKHSKRMSDDQKQKYLDRVKTLFKWELPVVNIPKQERKQKRIDIEGSILLYVGIICSEYKVISPLLTQLEELHNTKGINNICIFLLENNLSTIDKEKIVNLPGKSKITFITKEMQDRWIDSVDYFRNFSRNKKQMFGIAQARTILQKYVGQAMKLSPDCPIVWILDEDMQITEETICGIQELPQLKKSGVDIAIGKYEFSSPNPPVNGIRVQLVDFLYNLNWFLNQKSSETLPDLSDENNELINKYTDYYYDLSRKHFGHLEHPFWYKPKSDKETVSDSIEHLCKDAIKIFGGTPLTRPLLNLDTRSIVDSATDSVNRGGITFIFNPEALDATPNLNMEINGTDIRRSDMVWSVINRYYRKMNVKAVNIPIWHAGKESECFANLDIYKIREEILGSCLYAGLTDFLKLNPEHSLKFTDDELVVVYKNFKKHLEHRMVLLKHSFYRVRGISKSIHSLKEYAQNQDLHKLVALINKNFSKNNYALIKENVETLSIFALSEFLNSMQIQSDKYKRSKIV
ncbi:glycosyltransferase family A protein [Ancylomarina sp. 16SWW S1-10-2]|uniref:glycosyltransferase family 2 protein n=1 Tax=Ancylomarina sp. 16SWW S1-10-2 TaxID=2499681 RepID=UPI0012AD29F6|nr:glycosyltransferase family A protein [Ancylomarina sp. 16SWW S1-10-2]MRT94656.1 glycosyltransferase family 2 protein [Ancylomarina sp. 16SWW S1-10-2]